MIDIQELIIDLESARTELPLDCRADFTDTCDQIIGLLRKIDNYDTFFCDLTGILGNLGNNIGYTNRQALKDIIKIYNECKIEIL